MSFESISPNMNLPVPGVGLTDGPQWALDVNSCFSLIDQHDHSSGQGVQITASGINIGSDFPMNNNNLTLVRSLRFTSQGSPLVLPTDLGCLYESGVDLYFNDGNGNPIRITQLGAVVGTPGSITALTAPASATYVAGNGTFVWQQAVNTAANLDAASVIIRKDTVSSNGITIQAPVGLSADYSFVLPAAPPATESFLTMDSSGNLSVATPVSFNIQESASTGAYSESSTTFVPITNASVTIVTKGRPVYVMLQNSGGGGVQAFFEAKRAVFLKLERDGLDISQIIVGPTDNNNEFIPPPFLKLDLPSAGSHTYIAYMSSPTGDAVAVQGMELVAYEV